MRYLLDTNFISELRKRYRANRGVQAWALANDPALCALSVMTLGEIRQGVQDVRDDDPAQARSLEAWAPVVEPFLHALFVAVLRRIVVTAAFGQVCLRDVGAFAVVRILVAGVAQSFRGALAAGAAKMARHGERDAAFHLIHRLVHA